MRNESTEQLHAIITSLNDLTLLAGLGEGARVLVGGCFDIFHYGHFAFLEQAKQMGDRLIIALESDNFIVQYKGRTPVHTQEQRARILASLRIVDAVVLLPLLKSDEDYRQLVHSLKPQVIAVTEGDRKQHLKERHAQEVGGSVKVASPLLPQFSSTKIYAALLRD